MNKILTWLDNSERDKAIGIYCLNFDLTRDEFRELVSNSRDKLQEFGLSETHISQVIDSFILCKESPIDFLHNAIIQRAEDIVPGDLMTHPAVSQDEESHAPR